MIVPFWPSCENVAFWMHMVMLSIAIGLLTNTLSPGFHKVEPSRSHPCTTMVTLISVPSFQIC